MTAIGAAAHPAIGWRRRPAVSRTGTVRLAKSITMLTATLISHVAFWLLVWAVGPTLFGWQSVALVSGSMAPLLGVGDVIVAEPYDGSTLAPGAVIVFHAPGSERLTTHRIVAVHGDGTYRTRGDANAIADSTPVPSSAIVAVGRLRVPLIGLPMAWWQVGDYPPLVATLLCLVLAAAFRDGGRARSTGRSAQAGRGRWPGRAIRSGVVVVVVAVVASHLSGATFAATTADGGNAWAAASCAPGNTTLSYSNATVNDAYVNEAAAGTTYGTANPLKARAGTSGSRARMLLKFSPLPTLPAGCTFKTATLTVYTSTARSGLTYEIYNVAATWVDTSVTWNNQPATTGSPAVVTSAPRTGSTAWDVSVLVAQQYGGTANNGFLVRDSAEPSTTNLTRYASNEAGTNSRRPMLTVTWGW